MRKLIIILTIALFNVSTFGQTFVGISTDKVDAYSIKDARNLTLRINKDSTINFIFDRDYQSLYGEFNGRIVRINDTLYSISATLMLSQSCQKAHKLDTFDIILRENIATRFDTIQFEYSDGKKIKKLPCCDSLGNQIRFLSVPVDKKLFNNKKGKDFIKITINRKNFLSDNLLSFKTPYGSTPIFEADGQLVNFNVVIKNGELYATGEPFNEFGIYGQFRLKMKDKLTKKR